MKRLQFVWPLIFLGALLMLQSGGRLAVQDEETVFRMSAHLIERGELTITRDFVVQQPQSYPGFVPRAQRNLLTTWAGPGIDGRIYPLYPHGQPLIQAPLYLVGRTLGGWQLTLAGFIPARLAVAMLNPILIGLTGWLIMLFGSQLGFSARLSVGLGFAYTFGTMVLAYTHTHFGEPALALFYLAAAYSAFRARGADDRRSRRWLILAGSLLGWAILIRVRAAIVLPAFLIYVLFTQRRDRSRWLAFLIPIGIAAIWITIWNLYRFGSPFQTGDSLIVAGVGFNTPLLFGLYGLLLSPGKGLFFYNPIAIVGAIGLIVWIRQRRAEAVLFTSIGLTLLFFHAVYDLWSGGWNWGPRFLLPVLPFLLLSAGLWLHVYASKFIRAALVLTAVLGLLVNLPAALVDHSRYLIAFSEVDPQHYLERSLIQFDRSPLIRQWPEVLEVASLFSRGETWQAARQVIVDHQAAYSGGGSIDALSGELLWADEFMRLNTPDFWFVHLWLLGMPPITIGSIVIGLLALIVVSSAKVMRRFGIEDEG